MDWDFNWKHPVVKGGCREYCVFEIFQKPLATYHRFAHKHSTLFVCKPVVAGKSQKHGIGKGENPKILNFEFSGL